MFNSVGFNVSVFERFCAAFGKAGLVSPYLAIARRYDIDGIPECPAPKLKLLQKIAQDYQAQTDISPKWRVMDFCMAEIHGWNWTADLVMKRYNVFEIGFKGENGKISIGSNMVYLCGTVADLVQGVESNGPPYARPVYDGDDERLRAMIGDLVRYFNQVHDFIRRDLVDFATIDAQPDPKPSLPVTG